jgi:hypothetical protein
MVISVMVPVMSMVPMMPMMPVVVISMVTVMVVVFAKTHFLFWWLLVFLNYLKLNYNN